MQIHTDLQIYGYIYPDTHGNLLNAKLSATASAVAGNSSPQSHSPARLPPTAGMRPARGGGRTGPRSAAPGVTGCRGRAAAASRPGGPEGGGAPGPLPPHQTGLPRGRGTAPHRPPPASAGPVPALPAASPLAPNTSLNFQPRPLPAQRERGQTCRLPAAAGPSAQAPRCGSLARPPGAPDAGTQPPRRSRAPHRPWLGRRPGGLQLPLPALRHSPAEPALSRAAPRRSQGRLRSPAGRRGASSGRGAGQRPKPVSRTSP